MWQKLFDKTFQKHMTCPPFLTTKNIKSPSNNGKLSNGNWMFFYHHLTHPQHWMVTKIFWSSERGVSTCYHFGKTTFAFPFGQSKNFGHHSMAWVCRMANKFFQSPSIVACMSNNDWFFLNHHITHPQCSMMTEFLSCQEKGACHMFLKHGTN
jgi:hypothetical protein